MHAMHHYECVAVCRDTSLQRGRLHVSHDPAKTGPHRGLFSLKLCAAAPVVASAVLWRFNDGAASVCVVIHSCAKKVRRRDAVAPPGFYNRGGEVWVYRGSRVRSPPVPVVLSVYQRSSLLDGLAMYLSCDTKTFYDNESTHIT